MKIALLVIVAFFGMAVPALAHWSAPSPVYVYDFTSLRWRSIVQYQVNDYNAKRPPGTRYLIYSGQTYKTCNQNPGSDRVGIVVCSAGILGSGPGCPGCADTYWERNANGKVRRSVIEIEDTTETWGSGSPGSLGYAVTCHEFVHAIGLQLDGPQDRDSCMRGLRWNFGTWDMDWMTAQLAQP